MTKQKHTKAIDAASNAEELLPLEQMMSQGSATSEGAVHAVDDTHQVTDSEHQGTEGESAYLVPKLRFVDFVSNGEWLISSVAAIADVSRGLVYSPAALRARNQGALVLRSSNISDDGDFICNSDDVFVAKHCVNIPFADKGDIIITAANGSIRLVGKHAILRNVAPRSAVHGGFMLKMTPKHDSEFLNASMGSSWYITYLQQNIAGGNGAIGNIKASDLLCQALPVPKLQEQQRIGALFKELDHNIELNRGLLEKLTQLKKSMLEQMFPREGESVPRLRFAGFTEPWKTESFEQVFCYLPQINTSRDKLSISNGCVKTIHYGDILTIFGEVLDVSSGAVPRIIDSKPLDRDSPYLLRDGDILIVNTAEDSLAGKALEVVGISEEQVVGGLCTIPCRPHCMFAKSFLGYLLNAPAFRAKCVSLLQGTKVFHINKELLASVVVCYPIDIAEQQRIGEFFKALDQRITQQRAKLEKLGQLKKALLEQMFV